MRRALAAAAALLALAANLVAAPRPLAGQPAVHTIEIVVVGQDRWAYQPSPLVIRAGDTVEWVNRDREDAHNVAIPALEYDGRYLGYGESEQVTFARPGRYIYTCVPHPSMGGVVIVNGFVYVPVAATRRPAG
ncbi:MAG: hypothetical protein KatS3mg060_1261 [Dehalococcoidia bacterium]|jgi:plastocyanin|nr:MAG: hypothetical protein KatS3mg060_1261 [Dehalococcoidia bacterium]